LTEVLIYANICKELEKIKYFTICKLNKKESKMATNNFLKEADKKVFRLSFEDGLLDIFLSSFVLMFATAPFISTYLGDFWSSAIFLPIWGLVYFLLRFIRRKYINPRMGSVSWGEMRKRKLKVGNIILIMINIVFLILGVISFNKPFFGGIGTSLLFGSMMLMIFLVSGIFFDLTILYIYGILLFIAIPIGEWLYQNAGFSHHGFPIAFGSIAFVMFLRGTVKLLSILFDKEIAEAEDV
jgi:hypothetical protein